MINNLYFFIVLVRVVFSILPLNYEYPDEYWQGSQIAHYIGRGYGYLTWEWKGEDPIRNPVYQLYLSFGYIIAEQLWEFPSDLILQFCCKFMQIGVAVGSDILIIKLVQYYYGSIPNSIFVLILTNWFYLPIMSRTYINTFQTTLTLAAYFAYLHKNDYFSRFIAIIAYISRPTSIILWAIVWPIQLFKINQTWLARLSFILKNIITIIFMIVISSIIGKLWFGSYIPTQFNFIKYNIIYKWSQLYGKSPIWAYFFISIPIILGPYLPFLLMGCYNLITFKNQQKPGSGKIRIKTDKLRELLLFTLLFLLVLSFTTHKEHRFILVIIPFLLILLVGPLLKAIKNPKIILVLTVINAIILISGHFYGKTGGIQVLRLLRSQISLDQINEITIAYLCQAHSLPAFSVLLRNINLLIPDTSPMQKIINKDQNNMLISQPSQLLEIMTQQKQVDYLITQSKYQQQQGQPYAFLLHQYQLMNDSTEYSNSNLFQSLFLSEDFFKIYKRKVQMKNFQ